MPSPRACLHSLPPELLIEIFWYVTDYDDLVNFVLTSRRHYTIFEENKDFIRKIIAEHLEILREEKARLWTEKEYARLL